MTLHSLCLLHLLISRAKLFCAAVLRVFKYFRVFPFIVKHGFNLPFQHNLSVYMETIISLGIKSRLGWNVTKTEDAEEEDEREGSVSPHPKRVGTRAQDTGDTDTRESSASPVPKRRGWRSQNVREEREEKTEVTVKKRSWRKIKKTDAEQEVL